MTASTFQLTPEWQHFIDRCIQTGRYHSADDVITAALQTLECEENDYNEKFAALKQAIEEGFDSGEAEGSTEEVFARVRESIGLPVRTRA